MPDTTTLPMAESGRSGDGKTNWPVIIGVGGAGVLLLVLLMSSQKSGTSSGGTTAAGTSINAALGSIQEENLNVLGEVGKSEQRISTELAGVNQNTIVGQQRTADATQAMTLTNNALAGRILQQMAGMYGDQAGADAWTTYLQDILPSVDTAYAKAIRAPVNSTSV